jgi:membrane associated rhomboid family serine protease
MFYRTDDCPSAWNLTISSKEPILNVPATILFAVVILCLTHFLLSVAASPDFSSWTVWYGAFIPVRFAEQPMSSLSTLGSYSLLHGSWGHLINNCVWLLAFGSPIAAALGGLRFTLFWITCAAAAAIIHFAADPTSSIPMIGASGAVSGMMGAVARAGFSFHADESLEQLHDSLPPMRAVLSSRSVQMFLLVYLLINIGIGLGGMSASGLTGIAWQAHIGGLVAGFFLFSLFVHRR